MITTPWTPVLDAPEGVEISQRHVGPFRMHVVTAHGYGSSITVYPAGRDGDARLLSTNMQDHAAVLRDANQIALQEINAMKWFIVHGTPIYESKDRK